MRLQFCEKTMENLSKNRKKIKNLPFSRKMKSNASIPRHLDFHFCCFFLCNCPSFFLPFTKVRALIWASFYFHIVIIKTNNLNLKKLIKLLENEKLF